MPAVLSILKNPAYAGAFAYGRSRAVPQKAAPHQRTQKVLPLEEWKVCIRDKYPAYISWETFVTIQGMILDNHSEYDRNKTRGVPRPGKALLHGLVYCGECGHKMVVQYKKGTRYICNYLRQQYQVPVCQYLPADPIDAYVVGVFFDALAPAELDLYARAVAALQQEDEHMRRAATAADRTPALPSPSGRAAVQPVRPGQPPGDSRTGAALGGGLAGTPAGRGDVPARAAATASPGGS